MFMPEDFDLTQFQELREAFIDASSLIYMIDIGCLGQLHDAVSLYCIPEILREVGISAVDFHIVRCREEHVSNDRKLLHCAVERLMPLISEDKKLLMSAKRSGLFHYNALMMLNFLLFTHSINSREYDHYHLGLTRVARYTEEVWQYGEKVHQRIKDSLDT